MELGGFSHISVLARMILVPPSNLLPTPHFCKANPKQQTRMNANTWICFFSSFFVFFVGPLTFISLIACLLVHALPLSSPLLYPPPPPPPHHPTLPQSLSYVPRAKFVIAFWTILKSFTSWGCPNATTSGAASLKFLIKSGQTSPK